MTTVYVIPAYNAVDFNDTNGAYTPPTYAEVHFGDYDVDTVLGAGIASTTVVGGSSITVDISCDSIASVSTQGTSDVQAEVSCEGIDSTALVGGSSITFVPIIPAEIVTPPMVSTGGYDSVNQRTDAFAYRDGTRHENVSYKWDGRYQGITQMRPTDLESIEEQDRVDLRDIFTMFRQLRKAA